MHTSIHLDTVPFFKLGNLSVLASEHLSKVYDMMLT